MHSYRYIATDKEFLSWREGLPSDQYAVAVDLEAEFNLHIYGEHFCLLQVFDGREAAAIDPQTVSINLIKDFLESRNRLKITYDSSSDRLLLYKNHGILMNAILDLRPAVNLLGFEKQGLGAVLEEVLGVEPERGKKRFQQYDWTKRPIDSEALAYAIDDVVHLYKLRDALMKRISETGLLDRYLVENFAVQDTVPDVNRKPGILRGSRVRHLKPRQMKLLEALHAAREEVAEQVNLPPNSVLPNRELFSIVAGQRTPRDVRSPRNMPQPAFDELIERFNRIITEV